MNLAGISSKYEEGDTVEELKPSLTYGIPVLLYCLQGRPTPSGPTSTPNNTTSKNPPPKKQKSSTTDQAKMLNALCLEDGSNSIKDGKALFFSVEHEGSVVGWLAQVGKAIVAAKIVGGTLNGIGRAVRRTYQGLTFDGHAWNS